MIKKAVYITNERFEESMGQIDAKFVTVLEKLKKLDWIAEKLDWLIGKYKGHDEEHILVTGRLSDHSDRLETIEERMGIIV